MGEISFNTWKSLIKSENLMEIGNYGLYGKEELEQQVINFGNKLQEPPSSVVELLLLLNGLEYCLSKMGQNPTRSMQKALTLPKNALVTDKFCKHFNLDVQVSVASCMIEIMRITAPDAPYGDQQMKDAFQLIVSSFENLTVKSTRSYAKTVSILETLAKIRLCALMVDLECDGVIIEMFKYFVKALKTNHSKKVFSHMETIMVFVVEESDDISLELLSPIFECVRKDNVEVLPIARKLGGRVLAACSAKLKPYLLQALKLKSIGISLDGPLSSAQFSNSISDGSRLRVAYQGVSGAYSESAAEKAYPNCEAVPCEQFDTAFEAVERWLVDRAVLPIENSLGGSIHRNYDLLLRHRLHIVGEVKFTVRHCLLANQGVKLEDLKRVLSHPQALAQCENTLTKWGLVREAVDDTAGAAKHVALHKLQDAGAVASSAAGMIYGLNILAQDIQDDCDNVTRFLMLAREPIIPGTDRPFKTSIVFSLEEGPGVLFKALAVFALRQINLTKIESRPLRNQPLRSADDNNNGSTKYFDYLFYVDFEASMANQNAQNALRHLKEFATFLRVLGSYPVDTTMI
ncbi:arogenate dehydratase/prephenate dehydratase 2, chloroplastic-like isoform X1 [Pistacia vera]|uniref:arogenate dehydratase/prephenate dehydratase 2, chloroplastic-like isoform X1 n=1 Tax=Pistacia vera TaxID=55513 RepID=UPI0012632AFF|nr:arogenate dehydratase/prephenate dehydratase 2, chloroplastic-like isoform X1 [Pistacia vera]